MKAFALITELAGRHTSLNRLHLLRKVKQLFERDSLRFVDGEDVTYELLLVLEEIVGKGFYITSECGKTLFDIPNEKNDIIRIIVKDEQNPEKNPENQQFVRKLTLPSLVRSGNETTKSKTNKSHRELGNSMQIHNSSNVMSQKKPKSLMNLHSGEKVSHTSAPMKSNKNTNKRKHPDSNPVHTMSSINAAQDCASSSTSMFPSLNFLDDFDCFNPQIEGSLNPEVQAKHSLSSLDGEGYGGARAINEDEDDYEYEDDNNDLGSEEEEEEEEINAKNENARKEQHEFLNKSIDKIQNSLTENEMVMVENGKWFNNFLLKERQKIEEDIGKQRRQLETLQSKGNDLITKQAHVMKALNNTLEKINKFNKTYEKMQIECSSQCKEHFTETLSQGPVVKSRKNTKKTK